LLRKKLIYRISEIASSTTIYAMKLNLTIVEIIDNQCVFCCEMQQTHVDVFLERAKCRSAVVTAPLVVLFEVCRYDIA
jgi:hypothetical protein